MANAEQRTTPVEHAVWKEHTNASASVSIFLGDEKGRLLMVQDIDRYGGKWSPIAGFIDVAQNEEPEMAALREAREELGLHVRLDQLLGVWHYYVDDDRDTVAYGMSVSNPVEHIDRAHMHIGYAYAGTILGGSFVLQEDEIQNWGFFGPDEVEKMYQEGYLKTPQYNYVGYKLWRQGAKHPLTVIQSGKFNGTTQS